MKRVFLMRSEFFSSCVRGLLILEGEGLILYSLEQPWRDNEVNVSCIPEGEYLCTWHNSPSFGEVYLVNQVPNRSYILFHSGNIVDHTRGCILLGLRKGRLYNKPAVLSSRAAIRKFNNILNKEDFILKVLE